MEQQLLPDEMIERQLAAARAGTEAMATMLEGQRMLAEAGLELARASAEAAVRLAQRAASTGLAYSRRAAATSGESLERLTTSVISTTRSDLEPMAGATPRTPRPKDAAAA